MQKFEHQPDFEQLLKVLNRTGQPEHLPIYEHVASPEFISARTGKPFHEMSSRDEDYWPTYVDFWLGMGFDCVPMEIPLNCPLPKHDWQGAASHGSEASVCIRTWQDFEKYPWPDESRPIEFQHFETVADLLPDGVKVVGGVCAGPYEWASKMCGVMGLSYMLYDEPDLITAVFEKIGSLHVAANRQLKTMDAVGALRQGDDLGFKTSTFLPPDEIRRLILPIYARMVAEAHSVDKPFILHSCGNLAEVYDELIDEVDIDAKHSFEDAILPVTEFKRQYGDRVTPLGGLDVDMICRAPEDKLRKYVRQVADECFADGYWALGTGNSLTDYMPVEQYLIVLDEGRRVMGSA